MSGAVREKVFADLDMRGIVETHRPTEHVELVRGAGANRVGAVRDEQLDHGQVAAFGGEMNRIRVVAFVADVRIGAALEERPHDGLMPRAEVKGRPQARIARQRAALIDEVGMVVENRRHSGGVARAGGGEQRGERRLRHACTRDGQCKGDPALVPAFARKGVLHVPQRGP